MPFLVVDVDGKETEVKSSLGDEVIELLKKHYTVREVEDFDTVANMTYNFDTYVQKCELYSSSTPPDIVQFSEKFWGGIAFSIKHYALKNLSLKFDSHKIRKEIVRSIAPVLPEKEDFFEFYETYLKAEAAYKSFNELDYINPTTHAQLIERLIKFNVVIVKVQGDAVMAEIKRSKKIEIVQISPYYATLGNDRFECKFYATEKRE